MARLLPARFQEQPESPSQSRHLSLLYIWSTWDSSVQYSHPASTPLRAVTYVEAKTQIPRRVAG